ncbi:MAG TPA: hypothetical protein P5556_10935 [Candidatus Gastranaerophilales bacterium]|nr:hypothetical protein [Candidatus Gastranaerophilales bacterium]
MGDIRINKFNNIQPKQIEKKENAEQKTEQDIAKKPELTQKKPGEVLDYMANSSVMNQSVIKTKKVDVNKYVDNESADRIEKVVKAFEETILKSAEIAIGEFGLSEKDSQDVAILAFNQRFLV